MTFAKPFLCVVTLQQPHVCTRADLYKAGLSHQSLLKELRGQNGSPSDVSFLRKEGGEEWCIENETTDCALGTVGAVSLGLPLDYMPSSLLWTCVQLELLSH